MVRPLSCATSDRKSTRLNSSHVASSYAVFCLKKKKILQQGRYMDRDYDGRCGGEVSKNESILHDHETAGRAGRIVHSYFFFNDTATTEIYTLSLHDALPIWQPWVRTLATRKSPAGPYPTPTMPDRKSTRLNSSHVATSYAVFCLKKKNK